MNFTKAELKEMLECDFGKSKAEAMLKVFSVKELNESVLQTWDGRHAVDFYDLIDGVDVSPGDFPFNCGIAVVNADSLHSRNDEEFTKRIKSLEKICVMENYRHIFVTVNNEQEEIYDALRASKKFKTVADWKMNPNSGNEIAVFLYTSKIADCNDW